jgi:hypothetical protein
MCDRINYPMRSYHYPNNMEKNYSFYVRYRYLHSNGNGHERLETFRK